MISILEFNNEVAILRTLLTKCKNQDILDYVFKIILSNIYEFYYENRTSPSVIYNIDNCYKKYYNDKYNLGTLYTLDLFMRIKNNATRKEVKTIILTFRLASSNHYQLKNGRRHKPKLTMLLQ